MQTLTLGDAYGRTDRVRHFRIDDDRAVHPGKCPLPAGKDIADAMVAFPIGAAFPFSELVRAPRCRS
jgi:hypothetical protein